MSCNRLELKCGAIAQIRASISVHKTSLKIGDVMETLVGLKWEALQWSCSACIFVHSLTVWELQRVHLSDTCTHAHGAHAHGMHARRFVTPVRHYSTHACAHACAHAFALRMRVRMRLRTSMRTRMRTRMRKRIRTRMRTRIVLALASL